MPVEHKASDIAEARGVVRESLGIWLMVLLAFALFGFVLAVAIIGNMSNSAD
jgi:hypothetical protein